MDVVRVATDEFVKELQRSGISITESQLQTLRSPFNLIAVQSAVDSDLKRTEEAYRTYSLIERQRQVATGERYHETNIRNLSRQYAQYVIQRWRRGKFLSESMAITGQVVLKEAAGRGCDIYPCEK